MSAGTPKRPIRIKDELWEKAQEKAARVGTSVAVVIRSALEEWVEEPDDGPEDDEQLGSGDQDWNRPDAPVTA